MIYALGGITLPQEAAGCFQRREYCRGMGLRCPDSEGQLSLIEVQEVTGTHSSL